MLLSRIYFIQKKKLGGYEGTHSTMKILNKLQVFLLLELAIVLNLLIMDLHKVICSFFAQIRGL